MIPSTYATSFPGPSPRSKWGIGETPTWPRLPKWLQIFVRISSRKLDEMSSFRLNNGFRLQRTNRADVRWKQPPKKPFHHVSRDKILHDSWSISAALARVSPILRFERGEGPGDEVGTMVRALDPSLVPSPLILWSSHRARGSWRLKTFLRKT